MSKIVRNPNFWAVSSRDLHDYVLRYQGNSAMERSKKVVNKYWRASSDFQTSEFLTKIEPKTTTLTQFLSKHHGYDFQLSVSERIQILSARSKLPSNIKGFRGYSSEQLEVLGKKLYEFLLKVNIFENGYLSMAQEDIKTTYERFSNPQTSIIPYMKRHNLYSSVFPFKGLDKSKILSPDEIKDQAALIRSATCLGSFYVLLGLLSLKFDSKKVQSFIKNEVILGDDGIVALVTEELLRSKS